MAIGVEAWIARETIDSRAEGVLEWKGMSGGDEGKEGFLATLWMGSSTGVWEDGVVRGGGGGGMVGSGWVEEGGGGEDTASVGGGMGGEGGQRRGGHEERGVCVQNIPTQV